VRSGPTAVFQDQPRSISAPCAGRILRSVINNQREVGRAEALKIRESFDQLYKTHKQATKNIPILAVTDDMIGAGLVDSMARPNGNTTGFSLLATELDGKRQELLIEAVPTLRRMAALADSKRTRL
jgi:ABC transporter substrate binding protein